MRKFLQNKLWRDKAIELLEQQGSRIHWRQLNDQDYDQQLRCKLLEESQEVATSKNKNDLMNELADLYEVIDSLMMLHAISNDDIISIQKKKREERGGFDQRKFVTVAEHPEGSFGEKYCLADPEKYPEIG